MTDQTQQADAEHIPHTCGGFSGAFYSQHKRMPTAQEIWDAAIRSYRDRNRNRPAPAGGGLRVQPLPMLFGGCSACGSGSCVAMQCNQGTRRAYELHAAFNNASLPEHSGCGATR